MQQEFKILVGEIIIKFRVADISEQKIDILSHCLTVSLSHCLTVSLSHCLTVPLNEKTVTRPCVSTSHLMSFPFYCKWIGGGIV